MFSLQQTSFLRNLYNTCRHIHFTPKSLAYDKQLLSKLRKKTGFAISNCKKALELNENDYDKAEEWLKKEAQQQGWEKATKLENRPTPQGLVGVCVGKNFGVLTEVNCETDFVSRNENFKSLVHEILKVLSDVKESTPQNIIKEHISKEQLQAMPTQGGKTLGDLVALTVGKISENIVLTRATRIFTPSDLQLFAYAHPSTLENPSVVGRCGAIILMQNTPDDPELIRLLCSHIVARNPSSIGTPDDKEKEKESKLVQQSTENPEEKESKLVQQSTENPNDEMDEEEEEEEDKKIEEDTRLYHQTFIHDNECTVGDILEENNMKILDFIRYQVGETL